MLADAGFGDRFTQFAAALHVHPEDVVGDEDVRGIDLLELLDHAVGRLLPERALVKLPDRAEVALEGTAARGFQQGQRAPEVDVVLGGVLLDEMARRHRKVVDVSARRGVAGVDGTVTVVDQQSGDALQIVLPPPGLDQGRHDLFAVADDDDVDGRLEEPPRIARGVMSADDDEHARHLFADAARQAQRAKTLSGEVALKTDDVRPEGAHLGQSGLDAVEAHVDDLAGVPFQLETAGDALHPQRFDEGDHLQADDAADRGFEK